MIPDMTNRLQDDRACTCRQTLSVPGSPADSLLSENLLAVMWRQGWIILGTTLVAVIVAFVYLSKATPIYTSTSRIYVEQAGPRIIRDLEEGVMTRSKNYLYTQAELLKATSILSEAVSKSDVRQMRTLAGVSNPIGYLKKNIETTVGKKDDILNVAFSGPYPAEAAQVVNAVVQAYLNFQSTQKRSTAGEVQKILQKEKTARDKELSDRLRSLMEFKEKNEDLVFQTEKGNLILQRLERLSTAITEAQLATVEARSSYESAKAMVSDPNRLRQFVAAQRAQTGEGRLRTSGPGWRPCRRVGRIG